MSQTYYTLLTRVGEAKYANATALNQPLNLAAMAVGDGGGSLPTPGREQTSLVNEWRRGPLNSLFPDPDNPGQYIAEQIIPAGEGGRWIREIGVYDIDGDLVAVGNCPDTYKPLLAEGSGRTQLIRMVMLFGSAEVVELKIDPTIVVATREYVAQTVSDAISASDYKQSVRVATTNGISVTGLQTVDGVALVSGDRVLVKDQLAPITNGIYVVSDGRWSLASDANEVKKLNPGAVVIVEAGDVNADTLWMLTSDVVSNKLSQKRFQRVGGADAGQMVATFAAVPPTGTLVCNGAEVSRTAYARLFTAIGTRYGAGDGTSTFRLPMARDGFALLAGDPASVGQVTPGMLIVHSHTARAVAAGEHSHGGATAIAGSHTHTALSSNESGGRGGYLAGAAYGQSWNGGVVSVAGDHQHVIPVDGVHSHTVEVDATGGSTGNLAAGIKLLVCISY